MHELVSYSGLLKIRFTQERRLKRQKNIQSLFGNLWICFQQWPLLYFQFWIMFFRKVRFKCRSLIFKKLHQLNKCFISKCFCITKTNVTKNSLSIKTLSVIVSTENCCVFSVDWQVYFDLFSEHVCQKLVIYITSFYQYLVILFLVPKALPYF